MTDRVELIRTRITDALEPLSLQISDDSHLHVGHAGAAGGAGHYSVRIMSKQFSGLNRVKRHQLVYSCVEDLMPDEIHALSIEALTEEESKNT